MSKVIIKGFRLMSVGADAKTVKGQKRGYLTGIMYLQPADMSGQNLCPHASAGCKAACLFTAGMGKFPSVKLGRARRTTLFNTDREAFMSLLVAEVGKVCAIATKEGMKPVFRLNGTSDIRWEYIVYQGKTIFEHFPKVQFMDYTKDVSRLLKDARSRDFRNYHLTFSRSESNQLQVQIAIANSANVAVVFPKKKPLPKTFLNLRVIDGDKDDLRFLDKRNVIVGLTAKGRAKYDTSGFVAVT